MKPTEAAALLTIAAAYDNRKPDADQARAWAMVLDGLRFEDCRDVIVEHFKRSREWMMPADVIAGVKRMRTKRLNEFGALPNPPAHIDPDDTGAVLRWEREIREAIADGRYTREDAQPEAIASRRDIRELGQAKSVDAALATRPLREAHEQARRELQAAEGQRKAEREERQRRLEEMRAADRAARQAAEESA